ncbi:DUF302 domain-containing protein [Polaribacter sp. L3A8]|uniref:DUF302 domain-containing protein n=1 Tax=Polaribacter sp. L3A8 TaxID=2686361 RepID=UPI00131A611A|nr:DUF302 domain-containing protein [Polaribacter sp. L3A8]
MKSAIIEKEFKIPFDELYNAIRANIVLNGFLVLHEIDTQQIVANFDIKIKPLKQILFFHPKYIEKITNQDILAINEIPIKLVITEKENGIVSVSFPNPVLNLSDYNLNKEIALALLKRVTTILEF